MGEEVQTLSWWFSGLLAVSIVCSSAALGDALYGADALAPPPAASKFQQMSRVELLAAVKYSGCTFDGLLNSGSSGVEYDATPVAASRLALFDGYADLLGRSNCLYINRAVELWNSPPDFSAIEHNIVALFKRARNDYIVGVSVAESVSLRGRYQDPQEGRDFVFADMCKSASARTATECLASFSRPEYRRYVRYVIRKSIDIGAQVFLFGNVGLTDGHEAIADSPLLGLISEMKDYAAEKKTTVLFIAQFPARTRGASYINGFDLVQGAVYNNPDGSIPDSRTVTNKNSNAVPDRLWLTPYYDPEKLVMEYDWFGSSLDDTSQVACLSIKRQRNIDAIRQYRGSAGAAEGCRYGLSPARSAVPVTKSIYENFKSKGIGFWLPGRQPIAFPPWYYSPINMPLYKGRGPFDVNFDDEAMLQIPPKRG